MRSFVLAAALPLFASSPYDVASPEELLRLRERAHALDLSHTPEVRSFPARVAARRAAGVVPRAGAASTGMTVSDVGRVTVMRDATGASWETGMSIDDVFEGTENTVIAFFEAHPDSDADFVVIIQDWFNSSFPGAFYLPYENDTLGIGYQRTGPAEVFDQDPTTPIEGLLWLNGVQLLLVDDLFVGILWGQEFGHRWGAFVNVDDGGPDDSVLGRQSAHWSYYLDSDWSWMEGNDWLDNGDGTWTANVPTFEALTSHYSPLDLYLMGLVGTAEVPSFTLLDPAEPGDPAAPPEAWGSGTPPTITAAARTFTIQDVIAAEGPRVPSVADSAKDFDVAIVYALRRGDRATAEELATLESIVDTFEATWNADVGGRATITFGPAGTANQPPVLASIAGPLKVKAGKRATFDASAATDPEGQPLTFHWRWDAEDEDADFEEGDAEQGHTFGKEGARIVEVSVRDAGGAETIVPLAIEVAEGDPAGCGCRIGSGRAPGLASLFASAFAAAAFLRRRRRLS